MQDIVLDLLRRQREAGFPDLSGTELSATIPIGDRLINEYLAELVPRDRMVRDVQIKSEAGGQFKLQVRVSGSTLLPAIALTLVVEQQPELPARPVLGLRLSGIPKLLMLTGVLDRFRGWLPIGVTLDGDRIDLNLEQLLRQRGQADLLQHVTSLNVMTREGAVVVAVRARIAGGPTPV